MSDSDFSFGIKRPESEAEQLAIQSDIRAMRKAITFAQRNSPIVRRCILMSEYFGLSSEETMVLIAYQTLCAFQDISEHAQTLSQLDFRAFIKRNPP